MNIKCKNLSGIEFYYTDTDTPPADGDCEFRQCFPTLFSDA